MFEKLAEVKRCIENSDRSSEEKETLIEFAVKMCEDEAVRRWLREDSGTEHLQAFFKLVDMFDKVKKKIDRDREENINIIFVAHGGIEEPMIPASTLLPLSTIKDVVLYSPWNCAINAHVAYGVATGEIQPQHRSFICSPKTGSQIPDILHQPTNLPNYWNSMKTAGGQKIPNIIVSPLGSEDGAWESFRKLEIVFGRPGRNRIVIPFILPGEVEVPFFVITLALSLVLFFSGFRATVHLAACLSKRERTLCEDDLEKQYACTIDNTVMIPSKKMIFDRYLALYRALKAVFG